MSLSFPASPTNGQIYQGFIWNSSVGAWQPNFSAQFVTSVDGMAGPVSLKGRWIELARQIVVRSSPVASLTFSNVFTPTYEEYELHAYDFAPVNTTGVNLYLQFITTSGVANGSSDYNGAFHVFFSDNVTSQTTSGYISSSTMVGYTQTYSSAPASQDVFGSLIANFPHPTHPTARKFIVGRSVVRTAGSTGSADFNFNGYWNAGGTGNTPALTGCVLSYGVGNISEGVFVMYGRIK